MANNNGTDLVTICVTLARDEQRILVVADRDFGELIFHQALTQTGSIFRLSGAPLHNSRNGDKWRLGCQRGAMHEIAAEAQLASIHTCRREC